MSTNAAGDCVNPNRHPLDGYFGFERATRERFQPGQPLDGIARSVLLQMAAHRHWKSNGTITTKAETIAAETGFAERTVATRVGRLERGGWLVRVRGKQGGTVEYRLAVPDSTSAPGAELSVPSSARRADEPLHHAQKNSEHDPACQSRAPAPAGDGSAALAESPLLRLIRMRLAADVGERPEASLLTEALRPDALPGTVNRGNSDDLDALTEVEHSSDALALLDAVIHVSNSRLPEPMTPRQLEMTLSRLLLLVDDASDWAANAAWKVFWATWTVDSWNRPQHVNRPVEFVVGSVMKALEEEKRYASDH